MADIEFTSHRHEVEQAAKRAFDIGMEAVAQQAEGNAIREITKLVYDTPPSPTYVRTGNLRNSITHKYEPSEKAAYIGTNLSYAKYVEFGTRFMRERPYLRNAAQNYGDEYQAILRQAVESLD